MTSERKKVLTEALSLLFGAGMLACAFGWNGIYAAVGGYYIVRCAARDQRQESK